VSEVILKVGREKSILRRHPWIFSGAIERTIGNIIPGQTVEIISADGEWLGRGAYSYNSQIQIRILTFDYQVKIDSTYFYNKIFQAINARVLLYDRGDSNSYRLVHGESDGLPGLIIDRYDEIGVVQFLSAGMEYWRETIAKILFELGNFKSLFERSDMDVRSLEGLPNRVGLLMGKDIPNEVVIRENGLKFEIDIKGGHKTGFYLDQRQNRLVVRSLAKERDVLDCFCYTGGFSLNASIGGAKSITAVDQSSDALLAAARNLNLNDIPLDRISYQEGDVFRLLRLYRDRGQVYDLIILDPPKFAPTKAHIEKATRGYKDINLLAMKLLRPGGYLVTFSCSGGISEDLFQKIAFSAALDSEIDVQIIGHLHQATDHPVLLSFPEGAYLKGLILRRCS
jgi:23S rRNA (cytosine1962-C5)-methyltransferase